MSYGTFLEAKKVCDKPTGLKVIPELNPILFGHQSGIIGWALKRGRAAVFAGTGLGKSFILIEWSKHVQAHTKGMVIVLAPLAVASQLVKEAVKLGVEIKKAESQDDCTGPGIYITNYQKLHKFDADSFSAVVLDESSIIKHEDAKTRTMLIEAFKNTAWKLACTATPAPNDYTELGNHAEFLGVMSLTEMLSMFFVHDGGSTQDWRLKGHAEKDFWKWMASWSVSINKPSDLGFSDEGYILPKLNYFVHTTESSLVQSGYLFPLEASSLSDLRGARKASLPERCRVASDLVNASNEQWLVWCGLNDESETLKSQIDSAVEVKGGDSEDHKESSMLGFADGSVKRMVSKASICGFGMNFQKCHNMIFVGVTHSFEQFYQAVRRCWRFGQKNEVNVHIVISEEEQGILKTLKRKEDEAKAMTESMVEHMAELTKKEIGSVSRDFVEYNPQTEMQLPEWLIENGHLRENLVLA